MIAGFNPDHYGPWLNDTVVVTNCDDGSYCCGHNNLECCSAGLGVWIVDGRFTKINPALVSLISVVVYGTATSESTVLPSATVTSDSTSPNTAVASTSFSQQLQDSQSSGGLDTGARVGLGVGIALGAAAIGLLVVYLIIWRRRSRRTSTAQPNTEANSKYMPVWEIDRAERPVELAQPQPELSGSRPLVELS